MASLHNSVARVFELSDAVMSKVRADKKHTHTPEVKTTNKTVFFFALEKKHLPLQGVAEVHVEDI